jgi:hypothetical protein
MTIDQFVQKYNLNESVQEDLYKVLNTEVLSSVEGFKEGFLKSFAGKVTNETVKKAVLDAFRN